MEVRIEKKRLSIITDIIIFLLLLNLFLLIFKFIAPDYEIMQNLALENVEISNKNYIEVNYVKEKYGINIIYGEDAYEFAIKVDANIQGNEDRIYNNIKAIEKTLEKYPIDFLLNSDLTIVILDSFNNSNIALASRNKLNKFKIYISDNGTFERSLHHEMYHIFEYTLNINNTNVISDWNKFNPENFQYISDSKNLDDKYVYNNSFNSESYFVTRYSKTSEKEDRAEIFAEIMTFKSIPEYFSTDCNIRKKAKFIINIMTNSLKNSNNSTFYWNRF